MCRVGFVVVVVGILPARGRGGDGPAQGIHSHHFTLLLLLLLRPTVAAPPAAAAAATTTATAPIHA